MYNSHTVFIQVFFFKVSIHHQKWLYQALEKNTPIFSPFLRFWIDAWLNTQELFMPLEECGTWNYFPLSRLCASSSNAQQQLEEKFCEKSTTCFAAAFIYERWPLTNIKCIVIWWGFFRRPQQPLTGITTSRTKAYNFRRDAISTLIFLEDWLQLYNKPAAWLQ